MRINAVTQPIQSELRKVESTKKAEKAKSAKATDHSEISDGANKLSSTKASIDVVEATLSAQDDIRIDKIAEVQEKIKNGFYDSAEFIDKLAVKLLDEFGIREQSK